MTVTETQPGTMPNAGEQAKATSTELGKTPGKEQVSSEEKLYTQKQVDSFLHAAKSEAGRVTKGLEAQNNNLQSRITSLEHEIEDIQSEREGLQNQIEELSSDDPKKFDLIKKDKDLRDREHKARNKERELEARELANADRIAKVEGFEIELLCESIADEYEGGDSKILHNICKATGVKYEEAIRNLADTLWSKQSITQEPETERLKPYSGYTEGGGKESLGDLLKVNVKSLPYSKRLEHQRKLNEARKVLT